MQRTCCKQYQSAARKRRLKSGKAVMCNDKVIRTDVCLQIVYARQNFNAFTFGGTRVALIGKNGAHPCADRLCRIRKGERRAKTQVCRIFPAEADEDAPHRIARRTFFGERQQIRRKGVHTPLRIERRNKVGKKIDSVGIRRTFVQGGKGRKRAKLGNFVFFKIKAVGNDKGVLAFFRQGRTYLFGSDGFTIERIVKQRPHRR